MPRARKHLVCVDDTPYYHVVCRCVRRAFLCGVDQYSGKSYEHRRSWVEDRVRILASLFSIELCAYAVMSNHYHLVVRLNPSEAETWTDEDVLERWTSLFRGPLLVQRHRAGETLSDAEQETLRSITTVYRARLADLSWFMKCLNEPIARQANAEDKCTGHFWEARFHSQALLSEQALFAAMVYVDLNPIRAGVADTPESSAFTSVRQRLRPKAEATQLAASVPALFERGELRHFKLPIRPLLPFDKQTEMAGRANHADKAVRLPMHEIEYLKLVDATGRVVARGKRGLIDPDLAPLLERLGLSNEQWVDVSTGFRQHYRRGRLILKPAV